MSNAGSPHEIKIAALPTVPTAVDFIRHRVVVVVPAYNEERFIGSVVLKIRQRPVEVVVVDDGSTDQTAPIARAAGAHVIRLESNQGKGAALNAGLYLARDLNPDAVVLIDGDGQHLPEELPRLVWPILTGQADITVGSRYLRNTSNTPLPRRLGHRLLNLATGLTSGVTVTDSQSGYRALSPRACGRIRFHSVGFSVESEMQFIAHDLNLKIQEVPVTIRYTDRPKRSALHQGLVVLNGILRLVGQYRPLLFFGLPGLIAVLLGLLLGFFVIETFARTEQLAIGYALVSVFLTIAGLVSFSTGITLHSIRGLLLDLLKSKRERDD